jgi:hypothetical protein
MMVSFNELLMSSAACISVLNHSVYYMFLFTLGQASQTNPRAISGDYIISSIIVKSRLVGYNPFRASS